MYIALFGFPRTLYIQGGGGGPQNPQEFRLLFVFWPWGARECAQNDAMGCGHIFHTGQTQFWELRFRDFSDRHFDFRSAIPCYVPTALPLLWDQTLPPNLLEGRSIYNLGMADSSHQVPGPLNQDLDFDPKLLIPSAPCATPLTHPISLFPHLGAGRSEIIL